MRQLALALLMSLTAAAQDAPFTNINPSWSPDGKRLVFQSDRDGVHSQLYVIDVDGKNERRLSAKPVDDTHPAWSPDGKWILFDSNRDGGVWDLYVIRPNGTGLRRLTRSVARHPGWSPDGKRIVFDSDRDGDQAIYVMNADGSGEKRLAHAEGSNSHASWTPDGKIILGGKGIWTINPDGTDERQLTDRPGGAPRVSPDGRLIAYGTKNGEKPDLFVMNRDGSSPRNLTNDPFTNYEHSWSPDSKRIAYYSDDTGRFELYVMNADGSGRRQVTGAMLAK